VANGVAEVCWLRQLLVELHSPLSWVTLIYCDNVSAVYLSTNLFSTSAPNMLRLIFTLSESALPSGTFLSSTSQ
jgi:hypothetical protein